MYNAQRTQNVRYPDESPCEQSFDSAMLQLQQSHEQSYLIHSRSSRKRLYPQHPESMSNSQSQIDESCDIEQFKEEIQLKWQLSTSNKFYSFPFTPELLDYSSDGSLDSLKETQQYILINQNTQMVDSKRVADKFKIKEKRKLDQSSPPKRDIVMNRLTTLMDGFRVHKAQLQGCLELVRRKRDKSLSKQRDKQTIEDRPPKKRSAEKFKHGTIIQMLESESVLNHRLMTEPDEFYLQKLKSRKK